MKKGDIYYTGTIIEIIDPVLYEIKVDIPGIVSGVKAFPMRGEVDEPRVGDFVLLRSLDPIFQSYYLYQKIKENDFIGFRSNGKMVDITPDYIQLAIFEPDEGNKAWNDISENGSSDDEGRTVGGYRPEVTDWIKLDKEGNLSVFLRANSKAVITGDSEVSIEGASKVSIKGDSEVSIEGASKVSIKGDSNVEVSGNTTLKSSKVKITGGTLEVAGTSSTDMSGPFNCIPTCPFSGAPHSGKTVSGT